MFYQSGSLEEIVLKAKNDRETTERLIGQFKPFIASVIQKKTGRYLEFGVDDELSIGLIAFNESIQSYDINKGKFLSFARLVIINRLIDYFRKQSKLRTISIDCEENENGQTFELIDKKAVENFAYHTEEEDRKVEIIEYTRILKEWKINFSDLIKISPKQESLRNEYKKIAAFIASDEILLGELHKTKRLPIKQLEKQFPIHRKKIERGRIYIIALVAAIKNKLSFLDTGT
jgi:RNA polymerase sigma factor